MPVARNMKEIESMYFEALKKKLPNITTNFAISGTLIILN